MPWPGFRASRVLAAFAGALALPWALPAQAGTVCGPSEVAGMERCVSGLPATALATMHQPQKAGQWCWAAGVSMVLGRHGLPVSQEQVVLEKFGRLSDTPVSPADVLDLLNRNWPSPVGRAARAQTLPLPAWWRPQGLLAAPVLADLQAGRPLVLMTPRHLLLLVQVVYDRPAGAGSDAAPGSLRLRRAVVLDPATQGGLRSLAAGEKQFQHLLQVRVGPADEGVTAHAAAAQQPAF